MHLEKLIETTGYSLEELLPHRGTMLLIDDVLEVGKGWARVTALVDEALPFSTPGGVSSLIMVELAAQAAGIHNGIDRRRTRGRHGSNLGWLVGIKRARFHVGIIDHGAVLEIRSKNVHEFDNLREVEATVFSGVNLLGEITLQLIEA